MAADAIHDRRIKSRMTMEMRYEPAIHAFDRRGEILDVVHSAFRSKMEHWRVQNVEVVMADDFETTTRIAQISHLRSSISYEDPNTRQEFIDDSLRFIDCMCRVFPEGLGTIKRLGFRSLSVLSWQECRSVDCCYELVRSKFLSPELPLSLSFTDCGVILQNESTRVYVGPFQKDEDWARQTFSRPSVNVPEFGIGLDVDCYALALSYGSSGDLRKAARALQDLALAVETEVCGGLLG